MEPFPFTALTVEEIKAGFNVLELGTNFFRFADDGVVYTVTDNGNEWVCSTANSICFYNSLKEIEIDFS